MNDQPVYLMAQMMVVNYLQHTETKLNLHSILILIQMELRGPKELDIIGIKLFIYYSP